MITEIEQEEKNEFWGWGLSLLIHIIVLISLSAWFIANEPKEPSLVILSSPTEEQEVLDSVDLQDIRDFSETETKIASDEAKQEEPIIVDSKIPEQELVVNELVLANESIESNDLALIKEDLSSLAIVGKGATGEGAASVGGVVDRLTSEIISSASQKETLVVWLFDASLSLSTQRQQIADRLEKILAEIETQSDLYPISHVVCSFGNKLDVIIKEPTENKDQIVKQIKDIKLDESGVENIFSSVETLSSEYKSRINSRTMLVAFTDEVGDDQAKVDQASQIVRRNGVSVYVVGTPAPFGLAKTKLKFVDPDEKFDQDERWVEIEQGPESLFKTTLNINSLSIDSEVMDSGFGPYALSSLCASTGGIYFALHPNRNVGTKVEARQIQPMSSNIQHFFSSDVMRKYKPDYRSIAVQVKEANSNLAKSSLVKACSTKDPVNFQAEFKSAFDAPNQGQFANELSDAQKKAASLLTKIDPIYQTLQQGEKSIRSLDDEPRWKAAYLLALGRTLAIKTRLDAYNSMLADAKSGLKSKNKDTNRWIIEPSNESELLNSTLKKNKDLAHKYLETVVNEFPDTPWSFIAKKELETPLAYKWVESHYQPIAMNGGGNGNNNPPKDDVGKNLPPPKPKRKIDKI
jgi:hypothetical protein